MCAVMIFCFEFSHKEIGSPTLIPEIPFHYQSLFTLNVLKSEESFFRFLSFNQDVCLFGQIKNPKTF